MSPLPPPTPPPFDVVVFDLDGTLVDSAPDLTAALNHALVALGRAAVPEASVRHMVGQGARALLAKGLAATGGMDEALVEAGFPLFLAHYEAHIADGTRPYPGVEAALDRLAAGGVRLAICTNKLAGLSAKLVAALGWEGRFAALVGGDTLPVRKPDPAPLFAAIERAGGDGGGGRAAYVGDSITDTLTGRAARIPTVAVTFGFHDRPPAELGADALIDRYDQLDAALARLGGTPAPPAATR